MDLRGIPVTACLASSATSNWSDGDCCSYIQLPELARIRRSLLITQTFTYPEDITIEFLSEDDSLSAPETPGTGLLKLPELTGCGMSGLSVAEYIEYCRHCGAPSFQ